MMLTDIPESVRLDMEGKKIDIDVTLHILNNFNEGKYEGTEPVHVRRLPGIDGTTVLDLTGPLELTLPAEAAETRIRNVDSSIDVFRLCSKNGKSVTFDRQGLRTLGVLLSPYTAYGVLNGGSATSYIDLKKNGASNPELFTILRPEFDRMAQLSEGKPKGITPAFLNPDGTPGPSFLLLKMRALLVIAHEYTATTGKPFPGDAAFFQMTSIQTDGELKEAYERYREDPLLASLIGTTGLDVTVPETGVQRLIAAFTHSSEGRPKRLFTRAYGEEGKTLPLPGGHGQNFAVLRDVYRKLYRNGKRFAYLGNVDNIGYTPDPVEVAMLALTGRKAGFDFSFRTPVDVKGGVLVVDQRGRLNAADIGPAISEQELRLAAERGGEVLFNCATGLFDLAWLTENLDDISENLPMRWSDQEKDAGRYSQAEQVTWEVLGMLDDFLVFGIDKYDRFLAAKLLLETLMTSGIALDNPGYPDDGGEKSLRAVARKLHRGLERKLSSVYGMKLENGRWSPLADGEIAITGRLFR